MPSTFVRRFVHGPITLFAITSIVFAPGAIAGSNRTSPTLDPQLMSAINAGNIKQVRALLDHENIEARDKYGATVLVRAVKAGKADIVDLLLARHADVNVRDLNGDTPTIDAAEAGNTALAEKLISHGANVRAADHSGETALLGAVRSNDVELVRKLLDRGARPNGTGWFGDRPLTYAAAHGSAEIVTDLIEHNTDVNLPDLNGQTPLSRAVMGQATYAPSAAMHRVLTENSSALVALDRRLTPAESADRDRRLQVIKSAEAQDRAAQVKVDGDRHLTVTKLLIEHGARVDGKDEDGRSLAQNARQLGRTEIAELLEKSDSQSVSHR
jgi:ankyrin repeat protein